jgi:methylenetetrahydrofolate--tRNA-(uracil-5-)-methyltransferase
MKAQLIIIGGGLAGTEAAWQAAHLGIKVLLYEMRPQKSTPAHVTDYLAELVCSNSLGSTLPYKAPGLLKSELRGLGSIILSCAEAAAVPAGSSLAVDREIFGKSVTEKIINHPNINLICEEVQVVPGEACIIASGPLTSSNLAEDIGQMTGQDHLYFYDALSPIVSLDSIDMSVAFRGSRHKLDSSEIGDYVNCPMTKDEYDVFFDALTSAEQIVLRNFELEDGQFFEG